MVQEIDVMAERGTAVEGPPPDFERQLGFETLIAELSARFLNLPPGQVDQAIEAAQREVCRFLDLDISAVWQQFPHSPKFLSLTHAYFRREHPPIPPQMSSDEFFPWCGQQLKAGKVIALASVQDAPVGAERDVEMWNYFGIKSVLTIPLRAGGGPTFGAVNFNSTKGISRWPKRLVDRLQLVSGVFANALSRKRFEEDLLESEERLNLAADSAEAGLWSLDLARGLYWLTHKSRELFGLDATEAVTKEKIMNRVHPEDRMGVEEAVDSMVRSGETGHVEYRIVLPDGRLRWMSSFGRVQRDASGRPHHLMGVSLDVTDRKTREQEAKRHEQQMAHMDRALLLSQLSSSIAHELNQPLGAALANAQVGRRLMAKPNPDQKEILSIFEDVIEATRLASDIVRRLRGWLKNEDRRLAPCGLNALVLETLGFLRGDLKSKQIELSVVLDPQIHEVLCDEVQIQQVLINLVKNAWEAFPAQSPTAMHVTIRTSWLAEGHVTVTVEDNGAGIAAPILKDLFQPFKTTKKDGIGMGLSICRSIVMAHKGRIWAENKAERGAAFHFTLPLTQ